MIAWSRAMVIRGLVLILSIAVLTGGVLVSPPMAQAAVSSSVIYSMSPDEGDASVPVDASITFYFREAMDASTIDEDTVYLRKSGSSTDIPLSVSYNESTRKVTMEPDADLADNADYTVYLTNAIRYDDGSRISAQSWEFTTEGQNLMIDKIPAPGTTVTSPAVVSFRFTKDMDKSTVDEDSVYLRDETAGKTMDASVSYNASTGKVSIDPSDSFTRGHRYSVNVTSDVRYEDGSRVEAESWAFTIAGSTSDETDQTQQWQDWMSNNGTGGIIIGPNGVMVGGPNGVVISSDGQVSVGGMNGISSRGPSVLFHGGYMNFNNVKPYIKNSRTMLPMRELFEKLGANVQWNDTTQKVTATIDGNTIELYIGSKTAYKNGKKIELDTVAEIQDGSTMVPLRFVGEGLGKTVSWDDKHKTVTIEY